MVQHCQEEAAGACSGIEDERTIIGESIGFVQFCFEQPINRADDVGDNLWWRIVDPTLKAKFRIIFGKEGFVEMDNRILKMGLEQQKRYGASLWERLLRGLRYRPQYR